MNLYYTNSPRSITIYNTKKYMFVNEYIDSLLPEEKLIMILRNPIVLKYKFIKVRTLLSKQTGIKFL